MRIQVCSRSNFVFYLLPKIDHINTFQYSCINNYRNCNTSVGNLKHYFSERCIINLTQRNQNQIIYNLMELSPQQVQPQVSYFSPYENKQYILQNFQQLRIIQTNLLFMHGLTQSLANNISCKLQNYGVQSSVIKISTKQIKRNFYQAFVTFAEQYDTAIAMLNLNNTEIGKRKINVYYGSTKFCPEFLLDRVCSIQDCNYAHYLNPYLTYGRKDLKNIDHTEIAKAVISSYNPQHKSNSSNQESEIQKGKQLKAEYNFKQQQERGIQQIDWFQLDSNINEYIKVQPKQQKAKRTNVQIFLEDAQNFLLSLIFKHQIYSY